MDKNDRYFLYTKEGRYLSSKQQNKLLNKNHNIYISPKDVDSYKQFVAKHVLNDVIEYYLNGKKNKKAG